MAQRSTEPLTKNVTLSNGLKMRYYEWPGNGPALIFLHPSSGYGRMWDFTARRLAGEFRVFALDQRGHGDTEKPDGAYTAEEYAEDLHLFIKQAGLGKAMVAGHSLGGRVAQVLAGTHPEQVLSIILVGGPHYANFFQERDRVNTVLQGVERMRTSVTEFPSKEAALKHLRETRPTYSEEARNSVVTHNMRRMPGGRLAFKYDNVRVAQGLTHIADSLRAYAQRTTCPVAIMRGARSTHLTRAEAERIAPFWKKAQIIEVEADYTLEFENPEGLANAIREFAKVSVPA